MASSFSSQIVIHDSQGSVRCQTLTPILQISSFSSGAVPWNVLEFSTDLTPPENALRVHQEASRLVVRESPSLESRNRRSGVNHRTFRKHRYEYSPIIECPAYTSKEYSIEQHEYQV